MSFQSRTEFIEAQASEKVVLAWVEATRRIINWSLDSGSIYKKTVDQFIIGISEGSTAYTQIATPTPSAGEFYYDPQTNEVYIHTLTSADPADFEIIGLYRFFLSDRGVDAPWDLASGDQVDYEGRIQRSPGYKHKIGVEQNLTSVVGNGTLRLHNNDGGLDNVFDRYIFENQRVNIWSWSPDLPFADSRIIFRGRITNKTYTNENLTFKVKDLLNDLKQELPQGVFSDSDNVSDSVKGNLKRWIYGRVDGLKAQSVDQVADGFTLTGTISGNTTTTTLTGVGTSFLSETSPDDRLTIGTQEFTIKTVDSDTSLTVSDEPEFAFTAQTATLVPEIPLRTKNRTFFIADHATAQLTKSVVNAKQLNRIQVNNTIGILAGDIVEFSDLSERVEVKNVAPGNILVLRQNLSNRPGVATAVIRSPIQNLYIEGQRAIDEDYTISNTTETTVTLSNLAEFNLSDEENLGLSFTWTNSTRDVTYAGAVDLREVLKPRDWIRPTDLSYTTWYEILSVDQSAIELRVSFGDPTITDPTEAKKPNYIGDDTIVSADCLGKTVDGTATGEWIDTVAKANRDVLTEINLTDVNEASFTQGSLDDSKLISMAIPLSPSRTLTRAKSVIDRFNESINSSLTLDNDLNMKFKVLNVEIPTNPTIIRDTDIVSWKIKATNGQTIKRSIVNYRFQDVNRTSLEDGNEVFTYDNNFVTNYIGTSKAQDFDIYLYNLRDARIMSHRLSYVRQLGRADITIEADLRFENVEIGDTVQLEIERLYQRFGDGGSRKKMVIVVGKTVTGKLTELILTDFGNIYNTGCVITPNTAPDFVSATEDEKLKYGYITDKEGIVNSDEDTQNINLIT